MHLQMVVDIDDAVFFFGVKLVRIFYISFYNSVQMAKYSCAKKSLFFNKKIIAVQRPFEGLATKLQNDSGYVDHVRTNSFTQSELLLSLYVHNNSHILERLKQKSSTLFPHAVYPKRKGMLPNINHGRREHSLPR
jgi:hypothetical protein